MEEIVKISAENLKQFALRAMAVCRVREDIALPVVEGLVETSLRGVDSHGIKLLPHYIRSVKAGRINPDPKFHFEQTASATGKLDADHAFGHAAGNFAMKKAMELARQSGTGAVTVCNSSHFGAAACFSLLAARAGMIGLSFTHADALMLSPGGIRPYFGTNPISFAAPCDGEEPFCLDMATTVTNWNKLLASRTQNREIPLHWGADANGEQCSNPNQVVSLLPVGDYKGFGLAMMIDILCAVLTGMPFGRNISSMYKSPASQQRLLGHFFMAIDLERFVPLAHFTKQLKQMMDEVRREPPAEGKGFIQVPGDPEKKVWVERNRNGIPMPEDVFLAFTALGKELGIPWKGVA